MAKRSQAENKSVAATMTRLRAEMTPLALLARCGMQFIPLSDPKKKSEADDPKKNFIGPTHWSVEPRRPRRRYTWSTQKTVAAGHLCRMAVTTADLCVLAAVQEHPVTCHVKKGMNWAWMAAVRYRAAEPTEPGIIFWKDGLGSLSDDFFHHQTRIKKKCPEPLDCTNHQRR